MLPSVSVHTLDHPPGERNRTQHVGVLPDGCHRRSPPMGLDRMYPTSARRIRRRSGMSAQPRVTPDRLEKNRSRLRQVLTRCCLVRSEPRMPKPASKHGPRARFVHAGRTDGPGTPSKYRMSGEQWAHRGRCRLHGRFGRPGMGLAIRRERRATRPRLGRRSEAICSSAHRRAVADESGIQCRSWCGMPATYGSRHS